MNKIKPILLILTGIAIGICAGSIVTYKMASQPFQIIAKDQFISLVINEVGNASMLRRGQKDETLKHIEMNFPNYVLTLNCEYKNNSQATEALKRIKTFYILYGIKFPSKIKPILDGVTANVENLK